MQSNWDWIIVGGGPAGLTLAWLLATAAPDVRRILVVEREKSLGGCHRVRRVDGLFTEHGPRIYANAYVNFISILEDMGLSFDKLFVPYKFTTQSMSTGLIAKLSLREFLLLALEFLKLVFNPDYGMQTTVQEFARRNNFSEETYQELDRACRLTDGAGADRYTIHELLNVLDQHIFYSFYLPRRPNDLGLFALWQERLTSTGKVQLLLETEARQILQNREGVISGINASYGSSGELVTLKCKNLALCIPPEPAVSLLLPIITPVAPELSQKLVQFEKASRYDAYLPIIFHWDHKVDLPTRWGFPTTSWGAISMAMSDYMRFDNPRSRTVISTCLTMTDQPSPVTGRTVNETTDRQELVQETFRQINEFYGGALPEPTASLLSPGVYYDARKRMWRTMDSAFVLTPTGFWDYPKRNEDFRSVVPPGLNWIGTHGGQSHYAFTAMESAVTNALAFFLEQYPEAARSGRYKIAAPASLSKLIRYIALMGLLGYLVRRYLDV